MFPVTVSAAASRLALQSRRRDALGAHLTSSGLPAPLLLLVHPPLEPAEPITSSCDDNDYQAHRNDQNPDHSRCSWIPLGVLSQQAQELGMEGGLLPAQYSPSTPATPPSVVPRHPPAMTRGDTQL